MQSRLTHIAHDDINLETIAVLGEGQYGRVMRLSYQGTVQPISSLAKSGYIALKEFKKDFAWKEIHVHRALQAGVPVTIELTKGLLTKGLAIPFISYDDKGSSADLVKFFSQLKRTEFYAHFEEFTGDSVSQAFDKTHLGATLVQLAFSMKQEQNLLHQYGYYHLDTAARNLMVEAPVYQNQDLLSLSVKLIDFGLSEKIPKSGVVKVKWTNGPIKWMDWRLICENEATIVSDLYALKVTMITLLGLVLGCKEDDILRLPGDEGTLSSFYQRTPLYKNDSERLTLYLNRVQVLLDQNQDLRSQHIKTFIDCYGIYLTTLPDAYQFEDSDAMKKACIADNELFLEATYQFKSISRQLSNRLSLIPEKFRKVTIENTINEDEKLDLSFDSEESKAKEKSSLTSSGDYHDIIDMSPHSDRLPRRAEEWSNHFVRLSHSTPNLFTKMKTSIHKVKDWEQLFKLIQEVIGKLPVSTGLNEMKFLFQQAEASFYQYEIIQFEKFFSSLQEMARTNIENDIPKHEKKFYLAILENDWDKRIENLEHYNEKPTFGRARLV